jgi:hypothetical protein
MAGTRSVRRRAVLGMAGAVIALVGAARAEGPADLVDLEVIDRETGEPARVWRHEGRLFVAGRPQASYSLRVTNRTGGRVLAVISVDGVNVLTGETAGYNQRGYVFDAYQTYDVNGWRKSDREVAAFTFASLPRSYAARTGRPGDVGVIGVAAFRERAAPYVRGPVVSQAAPESSATARRSESVEELVVTGQSRAAAPVAPPVQARARPAEKLGTAHGAREWSAATTVAFRRATAYPQQVRRIEYDSYRNLVALGAIPSRRETPRPPRAFPSGSGYVPDPPGGR